MLDVPVPATGVTAGTIPGGGGWGDYPPRHFARKLGEIYSSLGISEPRLRSGIMPCPRGPRGKKDAEVNSDVKWTPAITLPAEGPVTRRPWLTPAYQGWGVERVSQTGDRAGTGLSTQPCSASLIHTSSEVLSHSAPAASTCATATTPLLQTALQAFSQGRLCPVQLKGSKSGGTLETV